MTTANTTLVWLVGDDPTPADGSRNLIRANAAAWGHKVRRQGNRSRARNEVPLAPASLFGVLRYALWSLKDAADQPRSSNNHTAMRSQKV